MLSDSHPLYGAYRLFEYYKMLAEKAVAQIPDEGLRTTPQPGLNSVVILMKHLSGNMLSRWTNFRTEDGEKPWRNRDSEFIDDFASRKELMDFWEKGWNCLFEGLQSIREEEVFNIIYIRNEGHTIQEAAERQLAHIAYHTGQIVFICKGFAGDGWKSLTIPKGKTEEHNRKKFSQEKSRGIYSERK
jgi:hypothetical protein